MQTTVAGLEELAQQSKINYTVVEGSPYYEYFKNMASAEEDLYKKWKDMTLSSNVDQARYGFFFFCYEPKLFQIFQNKFKFSQNSFKIEDFDMIYQLILSSYL